MTPHLTPIIAHRVAELGRVWEHQGDWADYVVRTNTRDRVVGFMPSHGGPGGYPAALYVAVDPNTYLPLTA